MVVYGRRPHSLGAPPGTRLFAGRSMGPTHPDGRMGAKQLLPKIRGIVWRINRHEGHLNGLSLRARVLCVDVDSSRNVNLKGVSGFINGFLFRFYIRVHRTTFNISYCLSLASRGVFSTPIVEIKLKHTLRCQDNKSEYCKAQKNCQYPTPKRHNDQSVSTNLWIILLIFK